MGAAAASTGMQPAIRCCFLPLYSYCCKAVNISSTATQGICTKGRTAWRTTRTGRATGGAAAALRQQAGFKTREVSGDKESARGDAYTGERQELMAVVGQR